MGHHLLLITVCNVKASVTRVSLVRSIIMQLNVMSVTVWMQGMYNIIDRYNEIYGCDPVRLEG